MEPVAGPRAPSSIRPAPAVCAPRELDEGPQRTPVAVLLQRVLGELAGKDLVDALTPVEGALTCLLEYLVVDDDGQVRHTPNMCYTGSVLAQPGSCGDRWPPLEPRRRRQTDRPTLACPARPGCRRVP